MITLSTTYKKIAQSATRVFSSVGQVSVCLYARVEAQDQANGCSTVQVKLVRVISGATGVGYAYSAAQATLSGSLTHAWSGSASGMVYAGEHTVFEKTFTVYHNADGTLSLSLAAVYDDSYVGALSIDLTGCAVPALEVTVKTPTITSVTWDTVAPTRQSQVTLFWDAEQGDSYCVSICRLYQPGNPAAEGEVLLQAFVYEKGVTFGMGGLDVKAGDELFFMVNACVGSAVSANAFSDFYRLRPTLWYRQPNGWQTAVPWVMVDGVWQPACGLYVRTAEGWRATP